MVILAIAIVFLFVWLLPKEDVGSYRSIRRV
jgi:hypothetical protein